MRLHNFPAILPLLTITLSTSTAQVIHLRLSDRIADAILSRPLGATRFLSIPTLTGTTEWSSPKTAMTLDGIPFHIFPLNHHSPDLLPFDQSILDSVNLLPQAAAGEFGSASLGVIELRRKEIPDSLQVSLVVVDGSELGDPLIHFYTRRGQTIYNRNQTGPSARVSVSKGYGNLRVRAALSRYNYFTTGGPQDRIIYALDNSDRRNQNQNDMVSIELSLSTPVGSMFSLLAGFGRREGWEMFPFTSHYMRSRSLLSTLRFGAAELIPGLELDMLADHLTFSSRPQTGARGGGYQESDYGVHARWNLVQTSSTILKIAANVRLHRVEPDSNGTQYFRSPMERREWAIAGTIQRGISRSVNTETAIRFDRYGSESAVSGHFTSVYRVIDEVMFRVHAASIATFPTPLESDGFFTMTRQRRSTNTVEEFGITPPFTLKSSRTREVTLSVVHAMPGSEWRIEGFIRTIHSPIKQAPIKSFRSGFPQDIVRLATYVNGPGYTVGGVEASGRAPVSGALSFSADYRFTDASIGSVPRHTARGTITVRLESETSFIITARALSRQQWDDFRLLPADDEAQHTGYDGSIPARLSVDIVLQQELGEFFSLPRFTAQIEAKNLFNEEVKLHPLGTNLGTILLFSVSLSL